MNELFENFQELVRTRLHYCGNFQSFGEDSIRYDFHIALQRQYQLQPHHIILEQAIPPTQFYQSPNQNGPRRRGRQEKKPEFDMRVDPVGQLPFGILAEFAFFRDPPIGTLDVTGSIGKIMNEIHRLALLKHFNNQPPIRGYNNFNNYRCLLICISDAKMIHYGAPGVQGPQPTVVIEDHYVLNNDFLDILSVTAKSKIEDNFLTKVRQLDITPTACRFINLHSEAVNNFPEWSVWAWEISYNN